ncbi:MAG: HupE/UreJ family protein [Acidobacteriota bacterium]|nr:HupE/UreJ family protein [Acidobacteriota bacterium]
MSARRALRRTPYLVTAIAALACGLAPSSAEAHLVTTGLGPVYDGISHVLMSPDDLVPILAMGMLAGLNGPTAGRGTLFALTGAWLAGGVAGFLVGQALLPPAVTTASFLVLGGLVATDRRLPVPVVTAVGVAVGVLHGWLNGAGVAEAQRDVLGMAGIAGATFVVVALTSALVVSLRSPWARIAVRVAGSWVVAIGLLMLGWSIRGGM